MSRGPLDVRGNTRRVVVLLFLLLLVVLAARTIATSTRSEPEVAELVLLLLTSSVTVAALVLTLAYEPRSSWPSLQMVLRARLVRVWAMVAVLSLVLLAIPVSLYDALAASAPVEAFDRVAGGWFDAPVLAPILSPVLALWAAVAAFLFGGAVAVKLLLEAGGRFGRRALATHLVHASRSTSATGEDRHRGFRAAVELALADGDAEALRDRMAELRATSELLPQGSRRRTRGLAERLLALDLELISALRRSVVASREVDAVALSSAFQELTESACEHAGALMRVRQDASRGEEEVRRCEMAAGVYLGALARHLQWTAAAALDGYDGTAHGGDDRLVTSLVEASEAGRQTLVHKVDPDPPGAYLPVADPWRHGLREPAAASAFLWGLAEPHSYVVGRALYAYVEVMTGDKFPHSFSASDVCMLSEIHERLEGPDGLADDRLHSAREHVRSLGGIRRISADLLVALLGSWSREARPLPPAYVGEVAHELPAYRRAKQVRWYTLLGDVRLRNAEDGLDELAALLTATRLGGPAGGLHGWALEAYEACGVPQDGLPAPMPPARPAAALTAVALRLMPLEATGSRATLERFLELAPEPLVAAALRLTDPWGLDDGNRSRASARTVTRAESRRNLMDRLEFVTETEI